MPYEVLRNLVSPDMLCHHLAYPLGDVSLDCHRRGEPLLSSIVVRNDSQEPGEGFWRLVDGLYKVKPYRGPEGQQEFLTNMQNSVFRYFRS